LILDSNRAVADAKVEALALPSRRSSDLPVALLPDGIPSLKRGPAQRNLERSLQFPARNSRKMARLVPLALSVIAVLFHLFLSQRSEEHTSELQSRDNLVCRRSLEQEKIS